MERKVDMEEIPEIKGKLKTEKKDKREKKKSSSSSSKKARG